MNKNTFRAFLVSGILFVLYLAIVFLIPFERNEVFWVSLLFTAVAFAVCCLALYMGIFKNENARSKFYGFSIARIGLIYAGGQFVVSLVFMALAELVELWIPSVVYLVGFCLAAAGLISMETVVEEIQMQDDKLKRSVAVMRSLQSKLNDMVPLCTDAESEKLVCQLAEEVRYSDPVSSEAPYEPTEDDASILDELQAEADLEATVEDLQQAIMNGNRNEIRRLCSQANILLAERNRLCKLNKSEL